MAARQQSQQETYYEILELKPTVTLREIKKSYRKLALQHHPDRNSQEDKEAATIKFRSVNEAYEVLSDPDQRRQYDAELSRPGQSTFTHGGNGGGGSFDRPGRRSYRDPFSQFNDLFQNDPFFQEAFRDMDDLFAKTFQQQHPSTINRGTAQTKKQPRSWGRWIADCLGIDFQIQTSTTTIGADGRPQTSSSSTSYGNRNSRSSSTYTSKSTRTVIENGRRVTIQSLEKDGNKIEERYVNNQLTQRLINGKPEHQHRIDGDGL